MPENIAPSPIGKTLVQLGLINNKDLDRATNEKSDNEHLISKIVDLELVSRKELTQALSEKFGAPAYDLNTFNFSFLPEMKIDLTLAEQHLILPLFQRGKNLFVATCDPTDSVGIDRLKFKTGLNIAILQCDPQDLLKAIELVRKHQQGAILNDFLADTNPEIETEEQEQEQIIDKDEGDSPIINYVNKILVDAINKGTSDIHFEPMAKTIRVRYRVDGMLHVMTSQPISFAQQILTRIKIIGKMDISEKRIPQDGRVKVKFANQKTVDFRINTLPTIYGEKAVLRILDASATSLGLESLGFSKKQLDNYKKAVSKPYGMVLITGPTGSGKTVTLYSALNMLNDPAKNISTVENPVEIHLDGITQVTTNEKAGLTFSSVLRAFLRQDPDILMLGEIRDLETAEIAIKASQTGHMVLSTLHTNDAPSTLTRLLNMGIPAFNIASSVQLIVAQRLVRKLCSSCKKPIKNLPEQALLEMGFERKEIAELTIYEADECDNCTHGYKGRSGVFQVLPITEKIRTLILKGCTELEIEEAAQEQGIDDLRKSALNLVSRGLTSMSEVERVTNV